MKNRFDIYDKDEYSALGLMRNFTKDIKEVEEKVDNKTDKKGNHEGSWQGINKPTISEEGMRGTVEKHITDIATLYDEQGNMKTEIEIANNNFDILNFSEINVLNPPAGLLPLVPDYYDANWNINNNPTDNSDRLQAIIDYVLANENGNITPIFIPQGGYFFTKSIVINKRYSKWDASTPIIRIRGNGNGAMAIGGGGTTLVKETSGSFIRICEEANGTYPGGGANVVTKPLNFIRRISLKDMNFIGNTAAPNTGDCITGRGVFRSDFKNITIQGFKNGIRLGHPTYLSETSNDGISLDYCERNVFENVNMRLVDNFITVQGCDITTIKNGYFSELTRSTSVGFRFIGGNDFVTLENNIMHFNVSGTGGAIAYGIYGNFLKGLRLVSNHIENLNGKLIYGVIDNVVATENMVLSTVQIDKPVTIAFNFKHSNFTFKNNSIFMLKPTTRFFDLTTEYTTLKTDISNNIVRISKESDETYDLITNLNGAFYDNGQWGNPMKLGNSYIWTHANKLYINSVKPTSGTDGTLIE